MDTFQLIAFLLSAFNLAGIMTSNVNNNNNNNNVNSNSNNANDNNINVDDDEFTTSASLSATLSPSIKDAIDVEKIALQDPKRFEDSALSLARIALVRLLARF